MRTYLSFLLVNLPVFCIFTLLKANYNILILLSCLLFIACNKDKKEVISAPIMATPVPVPFVEYRLPFLGDYVGVYSLTTQTWTSGFGMSPIDTVLFETNHLKNVLKCSAPSPTVEIACVTMSTDSVISINGSHYQIRANGTGPSYSFQFNKWCNKYTIIIRNDSLILNEFRQVGNYDKSKTDFTYWRFAGKKQ